MTNHEVGPAGDWQYAVLLAVRGEWERRIEAGATSTPEEHIRAITRAVIDALAKLGWPDSPDVVVKTPKEALPDHDPVLRDIRDARDNLEREWLDQHQELLSVKHAVRKLATALFAIRSQMNRAEPGVLVVPDDLAFDHKALQAAWVRAGVEPPEVITRSEYERR